MRGVELLRRKESLRHVQTGALGRIPAGRYRLPKYLPDHPSTVIDGGLFADYLVKLLGDIRRLAL